MAAWICSSLRQRGCQHGSLYIVKIRVFSSPSSCVVKLSGHITCLNKTDEKHNIHDMLYKLNRIYEGRGSEQDRWYSLKAGVKMSSSELPAIPHASSRGETHHLRSEGPTVDYFMTATSDRVAKFMTSWNVCYCQNACLISLYSGLSQYRRT